MLSHTKVSLPRLTCCLHERTVEAEREKRFFKVSQEVLEDAGDDVDVVHLAEHWDGLTAEKLLLQLLHLTFGTRQTVQAGLRGQKQLCHLSKPHTC